MIVKCFVDYFQLLLIFLAQVSMRRLIDFKSVVIFFLCWAKEQSMEGLFEAFIGELDGMTFCYWSGNLKKIEKDSFFMKKSCALSKSILLWYSFFILFQQRFFYLWIGDLELYHSHFQCFHLRYNSDSYYSS